MLGFLMLRVPLLHGRKAFVRIHWVANRVICGTAASILIAPELVRSALATFKLEKRVLTCFWDFAAR
jgi:hypothetical protein